MENEIALPGRTWQEMLYLFFGIALFAGLFSGGGLAFSFLSYSGREPVNVAAYFAVFVLVQAVLFLLLAGSSFFHKIQGKNIIEASLLYRLLRRLFTGLLHKLMAGVQKKTSQKVSAETRLKWSAYNGSIKQIRQRYGLLFLRPFFLVVQVFGVCFNTGVLAATLFKVIGADLAFGWQSTLQVTPASVHKLVHWIALPWSWLPNSFIPTLSQIEGSRLVLKEGIYHLVNTDLTSWWPFLCLSVLCYGLLPRLVLLIIVSSQQYRDLAKLDFQQGYFRQTLHRMRTPTLSTAARTEPKISKTTIPEAPRPQNIKQAQDPIASSPETFAPDAPLSPIIALIPDELLPDCPSNELEQQIRHRLGYALSQLLPFWTLEQNEEEELAALKMAMEQDKSTDIFVLLEAWQPPIEELLSWLGQLRQTIGPAPVILLALVGKPTPQTILTPVQAQHLQTWQQKTTALGDPGLQLIELVKS
jgi:NADH:ubiquinone oxidoreductase subunit 6 (subunit J)